MAANETREPQVAPGWYPDGASPQGMRYWDGQSWTAERTSAPTPAPMPVPSPAGTRRPRGRRPGPGWVLPVVVGVIAVGTVAIAARGFGGHGSPAGRGGTVWEETLGRDISDSSVAAWTRGCGMDAPEVRNLCREEGWELHLDPQMRVMRVVLYPGEDNGTIATFSDALPSGLTWGDTLSDIGEKLGQPTALGGGWGIGMHADYANLGPYFIQIDLRALHQADLTASTGIRDVEVQLSR